MLLVGRFVSIRLLASHAKSEFRDEVFSELRCSKEQKQAKERIGLVILESLCSDGSWVDYRHLLHFSRIQSFQSRLNYVYRPVPDL